MLRGGVGKEPPDRCFVTSIRQKAVTCSPSPQACLAPAGGICHGVPEPRSGPAFPSAAQGQVGGSPPPAKACAGRRGTASGVAQSRPIPLTLPSTSPTSPRGLSRVSSLHMVAVCNVVLPHRLQGTSFCPVGTRHAGRQLSSLALRGWLLRAATLTERGGPVSGDSPPTPVGAPFVPL